MDINNLTYSYLYDLEKQKNKINLQNYLIEINRIFSHNQNNLINTFAQIIFEEAYSNIKNKNKIILENIQVCNKILLQQIIVIQNHIILEEQWLNTLKSWGSKLHKKADWALEKLKTGFSNAKQYAIQKYNNIKNGCVTAFNKCKELAKTCWEEIKKLGQAIVNWFNSVLNFLKQGYAMIGRFFSKDEKCGFSSPNDCKTESQKLMNTCSAALPFFKPILKSTTEKAKQESKQDVAKLEKAMANGGNIDSQLKQLQSKGKTIIASAVQSVLPGVKSQAQDFNKNLKKQAVTEENIINKKIKSFIIEQAMLGITPKMIIQQKYKRFTKTQQNDIIVDNSKLSFKTNNGKLICQEINLKNNKKIIYESNTYFKGHHLIYEQQLNQYYLPKIIGEDINQTKSIICESLPWLAILLWAAVGVSMFIAGKAILITIKTIITICTEGIGAVTWLTEAIDNPCLATISVAVGYVLCILSLPWIVKDTIDSTKNTVEMTITGSSMGQSEQEIKELNAIRNATDGELLAELT